MSALASKVSRLAEATDVILRCGADLPSRHRLFRCYRDLGRSASDNTVFAVTLRFGRHTFACRMRPADIFTLAEIFHERQYEDHGMLRARPVILDAGANIGLASLWLLARYPGATVHAFEPEPQNFDILESNIRGIARAHAHRLALGDAAGEIGLHLSQHGAMHSTVDSRVGLHTVSVKRIRLGAFISERRIPVVDLLKLDVEGAELEVLEGLGDEIGRVQTIVGEVHDRMVDADVFYDRLRDVGFSEIRRVAFRNGDQEGVHGFTAKRRDGLAAMPELSSRQVPTATVL